MDARFQLQADCRFAENFNLDGLLSHAENPQENRDAIHAMRGDENSELTSRQVLEIRRLDLLTSIAACRHVLKKRPSNEICHRNLFKASEELKLVESAISSSLRERPDSG